MLIATHEMNFARDVAHQVVYLDEGVLVEQRDARGDLLEPASRSPRASFLERVR